MALIPSSDPAGDGGEAGDAEGVLMPVFQGPSYVQKRDDELWFVSHAVGVSVIKRQDGSWYQTVTPVDSDVRDAAKAYRGGYTYDITDAEAAELTAAGFGAYIT